jgi:hypothetical protein
LILEGELNQNERPRLATDNIDFFVDIVIELVVIDVMEFVYELRKNALN